MTGHLLQQLSSLGRHSLARGLIHWSGVTSVTSVALTRCTASPSNPRKPWQDSCGSEAPSASGVGRLAGQSGVGRRSFASSDFVPPKHLDRNLIDKLPDEFAEEDDGLFEEGSEGLILKSLPPYVTDDMSTMLSAAHINKYYNILESHEGWPKGLEAEFKVSGTNFIMYRKCIHELFTNVEESFNVLKDAAESGSTAPPAGRQAHFLLQGARGCGKSVALAAIVEFSRLCGAVVVYYPSCLSLVDGGMYHKHEESGMWDTPDHARSLLSTLLEAHGHRLDTVEAPGGGGSLKEVAEAGLPREGNAMESALAVIEGLRTTTDFPVVFALDDYNVLYSHTAYYEAVSFKKRRMIMPGELRLASALRMLEREPIANGICIAAPTYSSVMSPKLQIPYQKGAMVQLPMLDEAELERMAEFYLDYNAITERPDTTKLLALGGIVRGSGEEFRKFITLT